MADAQLVRDLALDSASMWKDRAAELKAQVETERAANEELRREYNKLVERCQKLRKENRALGGGSSEKKESDAKRPKAEEKKDKAKKHEDAAARAPRHCSVCKEVIAAFSCTKPACVQERARVKAEKELKRGAL